WCWTGSGIDASRLGWWRWCQRASSLASWSLGGLSSRWFRRRQLVLLLRLFLHRGVRARPTLDRRLRRSGRPHNVLPTDSPLTARSPQLPSLFHHLNLLRRRLGPLKHGNQRARRLNRPRI